ncbi:uncharacterized protein LOC110691294 [Chenopodium quinoa]|uniref:uncharacterized protein LOC110691294 n=1 Tax=Chenopodium quinoa TaxID=63459 RepID=UPI000B7901A1|nr:uncharacterized protein LOC110691294 [Chenopodium quinoa]
MVESSKPHPASLVTNIKTCIPIVLDYDGTQYNNWFTLFQIHRRANLVIDHVKPKPKPVVEPAAKEDKPIDMALWQPLDDIFARALQLDAQFTNTKLEQFDGIKPYCTHLKTLADILKNVGDKVSDNRVALQLLKGLSEEYKPFRTSVRHLNPLPSFDAPRSMLQLEEQENVVDLSLESREEAHITNTSSTVSQTTAGSSQNPANTRGGNSRTATVKQQRHPQQ